VTSAYNYFPIMAREREVFSINHTLVGFRHALYEFTEHAKVGPVVCKLFVRESRRLVKPYSFFWRLTACIADENATQHVLLTRHPQVDVELVHEPVRATNMIRMQVSCNDVCRRVAGHRPGKYLSPDVPALVRINTGIDNDPATSITEQPEVDVVEREGQWHTQPGNVIRHGHGFAQTGA
jgi:hypothetical protein